MINGSLYLRNGCANRQRRVEKQPSPTSFPSCRASTNIRVLINCRGRIVLQQQAGWLVRVSCHQHAGCSAIAFLDSLVLFVVDQWLVIPARIVSSRKRMELYAIVHKSCDLYMRHSSQPATAIFSTVYQSRRASLTTIWGASKKKKKATTPYSFINLQSRHTALPLAQPCDRMWVHRSLAALKRSDSARDQALRCRALTSAASSTEVQVVATGRPGQGSVTASPDAGDCRFFVKRRRQTQIEHVESRSSKGGEPRELSSRLELDT